MRISDWSSDVCSSDLGGGQADVRTALAAGGLPVPDGARPCATPPYDRQDAICGAVGDNLGGSCWDIPKYAKHPPTRRAPSARVVCLGCHPRTHAKYAKDRTRSEEHTSELQSLMRNSYAVF